MPPRRKAAVASATRTRTLHSFSAVGKNVVKSGKPTGKASVITETKKKVVKDSVASVAAFEIKQDGDEDVVVKHEGPAKVKTVKVKPVKAETPKAKSGKAKPEKVKPEKVIPSTATTPGGKRKRTLLDDFASSPAKKREIKPLRGAPLITPPPTSSPPPADYPLSVVSKPADLPADLTLFQSLHTSLLTALLLHRAHHNNSIHPPVFSAIKLHVERLCRRNISLEDVRRIVYLSHYSPDQEIAEEHFEKEGGLKLIDYGSNKICIDFVEKTKARKLVNSDNLKNDFASRIRLFWEQANKTALPTPPASFSEPLVKGEDDDAEVKSEEDTTVTPILLTTVPLAKLHIHAKAATIAKVLHTKGQQRLDDLLRRHKPATVSFPSKAKPNSAPPEKRGDSLLARIRAKAEAAAAAASAAPTKEEKERIAAQQRIPDIEPILKGLASRGSNMTMKSAVEGIRESVRNPVSSEQAEMAIRLIAERDGGNGWVKVREVGKVVGVVFGKRPEDGEFM